MTTGNAEQINVARNLGEQLVERVVQDFQPCDLGVAQVDHDAGAIGGFDPRLPQRIAQTNRTALGGGTAAGVRL